MTPQELRSSILQLAIQGRLVEQRPEEGTAEDLYIQIQTEKQALIIASKIKKEKPLPEITEDEIPFDIPDSWKWVRLGEIFKVTMGQSPQGTSISENDNGMEFHQGKIYFGEDYLLPSNQYTDEVTKIADVGSVLLCVRAPVGVVNISKREICIGRGLCAIKAISKISERFILFFLRAFQQSFIKQSTGTTFKAITNNVVINQLFPLPPLPEQKRIVAKIEELLPLVDRYEQAWQRLEVLNSRFPVDMQKSVLQLAIQGRLVPQLPEEGTGEDLFRQIQSEKQALIQSGKIKKEKPLPEITEDEIPFDIPESWKWVRISDVIDVRDGTHDTPKYVLDGVPLVTSKNLVNGTIDFDTTKLISYEDAELINLRSSVDDGDILFAMIGTIGNPVLVKKDREFCIKNMALFKNIDHDLFDMNYLLLFLQFEQSSMKKKASGGVQSFVSLKFLRQYLLPLPPLAEQKRIVARLEELLPLCEKLR